MLWVLSCFCSHCWPGLQQKQLWGHNQFWKLMSEAVILLIARCLAQPQQHFQADANTSEMIGFAPSFCWLTAPGSLKSSREEKCSWKSGRFSKYFCSFYTLNPIFKNCLLFTLSHPNLKWWEFARCYFLLEKITVCFQSSLLFSLFLSKSLTIRFLGV